MMVNAAAVRVSLGRKEILHGVDLTSPTGVWQTIIGPNGAGKSTLLRAIAGLLPFDGEITIDGHTVASLPPRRRAQLIAFVPQNPVIPPGMLVRDYVLLGRNPYVPPLGWETQADRDAATAVIERLKLTPFAERPLETLSGGERQRVFLARALAQQAPVLLLDEPTAALDIGHQQDVLELIDELRSTEGLTVIATMHDLSVAGEYADRLLLLDEGAIVAEGAPADVLTAANLATHYRARVQVLDGAYGPVVVPVRIRPETPRTVAE